MEEHEPVCPLKFCGQNCFAQTPWCEKKNCAWWYEAYSCCALKAIPAEISDRIYSLEVAIKTGGQNNG